MGANSLCHLVRSKPFVWQGLIISSFHLKASSIYQDLIVNIEVSSFLNMEGASFVVNSFKDIVDVVVRCIDSVELFFCGKSGEFVVFVEVCDVWIKATENSVLAEFVCSGSCGVISNLWKR